MIEKSTAFVMEELNKATNPSQGMDILKKNEDSFTTMTFKEFFNNYLSAHPSLKLADIIKDSGVGRTYAYDVINGVKKAKRDKIIALCFAAGMSLKETDHALIYSGFSQLYPKDQRDAIIIMAINWKNSGNTTYKTVADLNDLLDDQNQPLLEVEKL